MDTSKVPVDSQGLIKADGLEQLTTTGWYLLAEKFVAWCWRNDPITNVMVMTKDHRLLGSARKFREVWHWSTALGDGSSLRHTNGPLVELASVEGHVLPPISEPQWEAASAEMTSMMVTARERAAILAFRGALEDWPCAS